MVGCNRASSAVRQAESCARKVAERAQRGGRGALDFQEMVDSQRAAEKRACSVPGELYGRNSVILNTRSKRGRPSRTGEPLT
jgi:hypothetical protein